VTLERLCDRLWNMFDNTFPRDYTPCVGTIPATPNHLEKGKTMIELTLTPKQAQALSEMLSFALDQVNELHEMYDENGMPDGVAEILPVVESVNKTLKNQLVPCPVVLAGIANDYCDDLEGDA